jgi:hypothetical protein
MFAAWSSNGTPAKSAATSFLRAAEIFTGRLLEWKDDRQDYGERRIRTLGESAGELLHVVYTRRGDVIRIISVRRANRKERALWHARA